MNKRIKELNIEYNEMTSGKTDEEIVQIEDDLIEKCLKKIEEENAIFYNAKMINYKIFKQASINTPLIKILKKILNLRTTQRKEEKEED